MDSLALLKKHYKLVLFLLLVLVLLIILRLFYHETRDLYQQVLNYITSFPILSPILFVLFYGLVVICFLPSLPLNLVAGVLFGPFYGSLLAVLGSAGGAVVLFFIPKLIVKIKPLKHSEIQLIQYIERRIQTKAWRFVALVRIGFVGIPSAPVNILFGLTSIRPWTYIWASFVFLYPPTLLFSVLGYLLSSSIFSDQASWAIKILLMTFSLVFILIWLAVPYIKKRWM